MTHFSAFDEEPDQSVRPKAKRDPASIRKKMLSLAGSGAGQVGLQDDPLVSDTCNHDKGLPLGVLEGQRWGVSPSVAKAKLIEAGLPYEGRRMGLIYKWSSIFRAEGLDEELAKIATRETHPHLFDDLVNTAVAARLLGFRDASSIRKLIIDGELTDTSLVRFGTRGIFRIRPAALIALRKKKFWGRIV